MRFSISPFAVPAAKSVEHSGWTVFGEESAPLPRLIDAWDYQSELRLQAGLELNRELFCREAELALESDLEVLVTARSTATKVELCVLRLTLPGLDRSSITMDILLDGEYLGGRLILETVIVARAPIPLSITGATEAGAILWSTKQDTTLEGHGGLFPTDSEDFSVTRPKHKDAGWALAVDQTDMEALFTAAVRLTLNTGAGPIAGMLASPSSGESKRLAKQIELDVTRQLAFVAIDSDEVLLRHLDPTGEAIGDIARLLISRIWPTTSVSTLRLWRVENPGRLELDIKQFVGVFR